nr:hypothetical protein Iba_chr03eCG10090 [Ipomoea batatas]GMC78023.1 hypothetical protein Iba_chr03fCG4060 [Ipomoea batatas]
MSWERKDLGIGIGKFRDTINTNSTAASCWFCSCCKRNNLSGWGWMMRTTTSELVSFTRKVLCITIASCFPFRAVTRIIRNIEIINSNKFKPLLKRNEFYFQFTKNPIRSLSDMDFTILTNHLPGSSQKCLYQDSVWTRSRFFAFLGHDSKWKIENDTIKCQALQGRMRIYGSSINTMNHLASLSHQFSNVVNSSVINFPQTPFRVKGSGSDVRSRPKRRR